jgi:hypothetical protein
MGKGMLESALSPAPVIMEIFSVLWVMHGKLAALP